MLIGADLGLRSIMRERAQFLFTAIALAAVLGPLLVLLGLKNGVVGVLLQSLRADPAILEVKFRGHASLMPSDIERIAQLEGVGFLMPDISSIGADVLFRVGDSGALVRAEVWPSASGDPLLPPGLAGPGEQEVFLSSSLARQLGVGGSETVSLIRQRGGDGRSEILQLQLHVASVLPAQSLGGSRAFLHLQNIDQLQAFVDGYALPSQGIGGRPLAERPAGHERLRLYASILETVAPLTAAMEGLGYSVTSRADEVSSVLKLDRNLAGLFALIAGIGAIGYLVSFWASFSAGLARRRRDLSLLRLMGGRRSDLVAFAMLQGGATASVGVLVSFLVYALLSVFINGRFGEQGSSSPACFLTTQDMLAAGIGSMLVVLFVTLAISRPLLNIAPSEVLHEA